MRYFSENFGGLPGMFLHYFQIIANFLCVCQAVSWPTSWMKIGHCRDISCPRWDIFLKFFGDITGMFLHYPQIYTNCLYFCQSVSWLTSSLKLDKCRDISCSGWDIIQKFLRHSWDVFTLFPNKYKLFDSLLVG